MKAVRTSWQTGYQMRGLTAYWVLWLFVHQISQTPDNMHHFRQMYLLNPSTTSRMQHKVNFQVEYNSFESVFPSTRLVAMPKLKHSLPNYLRIIGFIPFQRVYHHVKCKQPHSAFELGLPGPFTMTITNAMHASDWCNQINEEIFNHRWKFNLPFSIRDHKIEISEFLLFVSKMMALIPCDTKYYKFKNTILLK